MQELSLELHFENFFNRLTTTKGQPSLFRSDPWGLQWVLSKKFSSSAKKREEHLLFRMSFAFIASFLVTISPCVLGTEERSATFPAARTFIIVCFTEVSFSALIRNVFSVTKRYTALKIVQSLRHSGFILIKWKENSGRRFMDQFGTERNWFQ